MRPEDASYTCQLKIRVCSKLSVAERAGIEKVLETSFPEFGSDGGLTDDKRQHVCYSLDRTVPSGPAGIKSASAAKKLVNNFADDAEQLALSTLGNVGGHSFPFEIRVECAPTHIFPEEEDPSFTIERDFGIRNYFRLSAARQSAAEELASFVKFTETRGRDSR